MYKCCHDCFLDNENLKLVSPVSHNSQGVKMCSDPWITLSVMVNSILVHLVLFVPFILLLGGGAGSYLSPRLA